MSDLVLVTDGTGKTGRRVAAQLRARWVAVRAVSRSTNPALDWTDEASWDAVLDGVDALAPAEGSRATAAFAERAAKAGVRRIVLLSARGVTTPGYFEDQGVLAPQFVDGETGVMATGADWTLVRPGWFMQNFDEGDFLGPVRAGRLELMPCGVALEGRASPLWFGPPVRVKLEVANTNPSSEEAQHGIVCRD